MLEGVGEAEEGRFAVGAAGEQEVDGAAAVEAGIQGSLPMVR
jgi:hypothetical protein